MAIEWGSGMKKDKKQERIEAIEKILRSFGIHCEQGHSGTALATAIEESIGVDEDMLMEVIYKNSKVISENEVQITTTQWVLGNAISNNKDIITIGGGNEKNT